MPKRKTRKDTNSLCYYLSDKLHPQKVINLRQGSEYEHCSEAFLLEFAVATDPPYDEVRKITLDHYLVVHSGKELYAPSEKRGPNTIVLEVAFTGARKYFYSDLDFRVALQYGPRKKKEGIIQVKAYEQWRITPPLGGLPFF